MLCLNWEKSDTKLENFKLGLYGWTEGQGKGRDREKEMAAHHRLSCT